VNCLRHATISPRHSAPRWDDLVCTSLPTQHKQYGTLPISRPSPPCSVFTSVLQNRHVLNMSLKSSFTKESQQSIPIVILYAPFPELTLSMGRHTSSAPSMASEPSDFALFSLLRDRLSLLWDRSRVVLRVPGTEGDRFWGQSGEEGDSRVESQWNGQDAIFSHGDRRQQTGDSWFGDIYVRCQLYTSERNGMQPSIQVEPPLPRSPLPGRQSDGVGEHKNRLVCPKRRSVPQARTAYAWIPVRRVQTPCAVADTDTRRGMQPTCSRLPCNDFGYWARISVWCFGASLARIGRVRRAFRAHSPNEGAALWL
jgi:hypothetical protein